MGRFSQRLFVSYSVFYIVGLLMSMQIPFVGFQPIRTSEHMAASGKTFHHGFFSSCSSASLNFSVSTLGWSSHDSLCASWKYGVQCRHAELHQIVPWLWFTLQLIAFTLNKRNIIMSNILCSCFTWIFHQTLFVYIFKYLLVTDRVFITFCLHFSYNQVQHVCNFTSNWFDKEWVLSQSTRKQLGI